VDSFNVNKNYAAVIHRDGNNFGPSMISAFGDFEGGALNYYPHDDGKIDLQKLEKTKSKAQNLDLKNGLVLFNGNNAHQVDSFEGTRFSIVYFTLGCHAKMKQEDRARLSKMGVPTPKEDENPFCIISAPNGQRSDKKYAALLAAATPMKKRVLPPSMFWKKSVLAAGKKRKA